MEFITQWSDWVALAAILVQVALAVFGGTASISITNTFKEKLNFEGPAALILSYVVASLMGVLLAVATGALNPEIFANPVAIATVIVTTILANEKGYQAQKAQAAKFQD